VSTAWVLREYCVVAAASLRRVEGMVLARQDAVMILKGYGILGRGNMDCTRSHIHKVDVR
jgi:hypothetical protein